MKSLVNQGFAPTGGLGAEGLEGKSNFQVRIRPALGLGLLLSNMPFSRCEARAADFSNATRLNAARANQTATRLSDGRLLVAGGVSAPAAKAFYPTTHQ